MEYGVSSTFPAGMSWRPPPRHASGPFPRITSRCPLRRPLPLTEGGVTMAPLLGVRGLQIRGFSCALRATRLAQRRPSRTSRAMPDSARLASSTWRTEKPRTTTLCRRRKRIALGRGEEIVHRTSGSPAGNGPMDKQHENRDEGGSEARSPDSARIVSIQGEGNGAFSGPAPFYWEGAAAGRVTASSSVAGHHSSRRRFIRAMRLVKTGEAARFVVSPGSCRRS